MAWTGPNLSGSIDPRVMDRIKAMQAGNMSAPKAQIDDAGPAKRAGVPDSSGIFAAMAPAEASDAPQDIGDADVNMIPDAPLDIHADAGYGADPVKLANALDANAVQGNVLPPSLGDFSGGPPPPVTPADTGAIQDYIKSQTMAAQPPMPPAAPPPPPGAAGPMAGPPVGAGSGPGPMSAPASVMPGGMMQPGAAPPDMAQMQADYLRRQFMQQRMGAGR